jgi:hypothetical protein
LISLNSGVPATANHSKATISRVTTRMPSSRIRVSATSRSPGRRDAMASATT